MGLPGCWVVLLLRAVVVHPTECPLPSPVRGENGCNLQAQVDPRHSEHTTFRGCIPTAHVLACLRIADGIAAAVARLATGWAGSPFAGRGSHPLDDDSEFREAIACLLLSDQPCLVAHLVVVLYAAHTRALNGPQVRELQRDSGTGNQRHPACGLDTINVIQENDCLHGISF